MSKVSHYISHKPLERSLIIYKLMVLKAQKILVEGLNLYEKLIQIHKNMRAWIYSKRVPISKLMKIGHYVNKIETVD